MILDVDGFGRSILQDVGAWSGIDSKEHKRFSVFLVITRSRV